MQIQVLIIADIDKTHEEKFDQEMVNKILAGAAGGVAASLLMEGLKARIRLPHDLSIMFPPTFSYVLNGVDTDHSNALVI
jgi:hypothetical protein